MDILTNKEYKQYNNLSRYTTVPYYYNTLDEKYMMGTSKHLKRNTQYIVHTTKAGDTYDGLSLSYYDNPTFYWIICEFNDVSDCFVPPVKGTTLKIPVLSYIEFEE